MKLSLVDLIRGRRRDFFAWASKPRPRPVSLPQPPAVRMSMKQALRAASWYPAKAIDGSLEMQVVVELECINKTSSEIRVVSARLRNHAAEQTALLVGMLGSEPNAANKAIPPHG